MTDKPVFPGWDCRDDTIDATHSIARVMVGSILREFHIGDGPLNPSQAVQDIINKIVSDNVEAALQMAARGLEERLKDGLGQIDTLEAIRIVIELDAPEE